MPTDDKHDSDVPTTSLPGTFSVAAGNNNGLRLSETTSASIANTGQDDTEVFSEDDNDSSSQMITSSDESLMQFDEPLSCRADDV
jgi:hypothetical protein